MIYVGLEASCINEVLVICEVLKALDHVYIANWWVYSDRVCVGMYMCGHIHVSECRCTHVHTHIHTYTLLPPHRGYCFKFQVYKSPRNMSFVT